jgi:hypothetical protein
MNINIDYSDLFYKLFFNFKLHNFIKKILDNFIKKILDNFIC